MKDKPIRAEGIAPFVLAPQRANGDPYTTSEIIAEGANVMHQAIQRLITKHESDFKEFGRVRFEIEPRKTRGGTQGIKVYRLSEEQATLLMTYLKNTERVRTFKKELVRQFYAMRSLLLERQSPIWQDTRSLGKEIRRQETDTIKRLVDYATAQGSRNAAVLYQSFQAGGQDGGHCGAGQGPDGSACGVDAGGKSNCTGNYGRY